MINEDSEKAEQTNYVGSMPILTAVVDSIDKHIFNCKLDGIKLEWCDSLKSRAAVSYEQSSNTTKQIYIRFSKEYFQNCSRKNFVEAVLYEMVDVILAIQKKDDNDDLYVFLLDAAFNYFNRSFGTNLKVNNNYKANYSEDKEIEEILKNVAMERKIPSEMASISNYTPTPIMKVTKKLKRKNCMNILKKIAKSSIDDHIVLWDMRTLNKIISYLLREP